MINIRRNPLIAIGLQLPGAACLAIGIWLNMYWLVVPGVILFGAGALLLINPAVTIERDAVVLKNLLGLPGVSYPHDGIAALSIVEGKLLIRHQGRQAIMRRVAKSRLHPGDWRAFEQALADLHSKSKAPKP